jgi:hypothetical protein
MRLWVACWTAMGVVAAGPLEAQAGACALLSQAEVEAAIGRRVTAPTEENFPQQSACGFGDPEAPRVNGRVVFTLVSLTLFTLDSPAAAREFFAMGKENAASVEVVSGLGDEAFWDKVLHTLWIRRGARELAVDVGNDLGGLGPAKVLAAKALATLP